MDFLPWLDLGQTHWLETQNDYNSQVQTLAEEHEQQVLTLQHEFDHRLGELRQQYYRQQDEWCAHVRQRVSAEQAQGTWTPACQEALEHWAQTQGWSA